MLLIAVCCPVYIPDISVLSSVCVPMMSVWRVPEISVLSSVCVTMMSVWCPVFVCY